MNKEQAENWQFEVKLANIMVRQIFWNTHNLILLCLLFSLVAIYGPTWGWVSATFWVTARIVLAWCCSILFVGLLGNLPRWSPLLMASMPLSFQRPYYETAKQRALRVKISPLVDYPFHLFIELNLDAEFEKGGYFRALDAMDEWLESYPDKLIKLVDKLSHSPDKEELGDMADELSQENLDEQR